MVSSALWNIILIYLGISFGENVDLIDGYLKTYSNIIWIITGIIILFFVVQIFYNKEKKIKLKFLFKRQAISIEEKKKEEMIKYF